MSGTFMDGGGQGGDGGGFGHGSNLGHGVGDSAFIDGANQSGLAGHSQAGHVQVGQGGDGFLSNLLGQQGQHSFLGHLLGLDSGSNAGQDHGAQQGHSGANGHSNTAMFTSALQALKVENIVSGLKFTPAMGMFCLFLGFTSWLFVVYFIRHHEPFANSVLGTVPQSLAVSTDRRLINGVKGAMPFKTSKATGDFYEPLPGTPTAMAPAPAMQSFTPVASTQPNGVAIAAPYVGSTSRFGAPRQVGEQESAPYQQFAQQPVAPQSVAPSFAAPVLQSSFGTPTSNMNQSLNNFPINPDYSVQTVQAGPVTKLKTFTNH